LEQNDTTTPAVDSRKAWQ